MHDLLRLRLAVVAGEMTRTEAAASIGIPPGTLSGRWRVAGLIESHPMHTRYHPLRRQVRAAIERHPGATDEQIHAALVADGHKIARCTVRSVRCRLGIGCSRERARLSDEELREARRRVVAREASVREVARELGKAAGTVYKGWRRLGLIDGEPPQGLTIGKRGPREAPVRDEVAVYLRDYPWMNARQIADAMTADGQPVSVYAVRTHRRRLRAKGVAGG